MTDQFQTAAEAWQEFKDIVCVGLPEPVEQRLRAVFFAGYRSAFMAMWALPDKSKEAGKQAIFRMMTEMAAFEEELRQRADREPTEET